MVLLFPISYEFGMNLSNLALILNLFAGFKISDFSTVNCPNENKSSAAFAGSFMNAGFCFSSTCNVGPPSSI
jgi:hypothetical protein